MTRKDAFTAIFDILENTGNVKYTKTYTRDKLIQLFTENKAINTVNRYLLEKKTCGIHLDEYLLIKYLNIRPCTSCSEVYPLDEFSSKRPTCKKCDTIRSKKYRKEHLEERKEYSRKHYENNKQYYLDRNAKYRTRFKLATPKWADLEAISKFYRNKPSNLYHVDHIIPLKGKLVSGLHILENLQYLLIKDNLTKSNKFKH